MKRTFLIIIVSFIVTLTVIFGIRASADALAVVLGVILGVVASVPTTFLVTYILTRPRSSTESPLPQFPQQPPVVIVNGSDKATLPSSPNLPTLAPPAHSRKWTVIGDVDTEVDA